ncbi:uncharacterized protein LOC103316672 [Nasonia vitripennis]|uniref:Uncharacterized protein n=1 Tax=Nasonia vitripennis TaxID=7425 RepID=A0A7M7H619_NASVI|nr:uncharacterized protein LOC103316672 [Nasonia vitripennis]
MASDEANPAVKRVCSKDHKAREKASAEKYVQKLKRPLKRISATQKYMYTFGEVASDVIDYKGKRDNYTDGTKRSLSTEQNKSKKTISDVLKRQESSATSKSSQWSDVEKQLKSIRSHKKQINQLITKELRDTKISWQEITSNKSFANVRNKLNQSQDSHVEKLCESLEKSTQEVENFYRSFTGLDSLKNDHASKIVEQHENAKFAYERGDNNEIISLENYAETMDTCYIGDNAPKEFPGENGITLKKSIFSTTNAGKNSSINETYSSPTKSMYSDIESTANRFADLNISANLCRNTKTNNNETINCNEEDTNSFNESRKYSRAGGWTNTLTKQNCDSSCQIGTSIPANFVRKLPTDNHAIPQLCKSEYLRKSCGLN